MVTPPDFMAPLLPSVATLHVDLATQQLTHIHRDGMRRHYAISTSKHGAGEQQNSFCTPRGLHVIRAKIGDAADPFAVFKGRRRTGEKYIEKDNSINDIEITASPRDWILGRILWLSGLEPYFNRGGSVDTMRRFIYIHGTPPNVNMQLPSSIGCIRMQCDAVIDLFNHISIGERVMIHENMDRPAVIVQRWHSVYETCQSIRRLVFQQEQCIDPQKDEDGHDARWLHLLAFPSVQQAISSASLHALEEKRCRAVGTARLEYHKNENCVHWKLGRMAILENMRYQGIGRMMLEKAKKIIVYSSNTLPTTLSVHAQANAMAFYRRCGFVSQGEVFDEAGIVHQKMIITVE